MTTQLDLFTRPPDLPRHSPAAPTDPVQGISVRLSDRCQCGSCDAVIGEGKGPHPASLFCSRCERHRGWLANEAHVSLLKLSRNSASQRPRLPFDATEQIRRHEAKNSNNATLTDNLSNMEGLNVQRYHESRLTSINKRRA